MIRPYIPGSLLLAGALFLSPLAKGAETNSVNSSSVNITNAVPSLSRGIEDIIRMSEAGVPAQVIKKYVESSTVPYNLSPSDLIQMKERRVNDEVTEYVITRGAELRKTQKEIERRENFMDERGPFIDAVLYRRDARLRLQYGKKENNINN